MSMHDVKDLIPYALSISRAFANHSHDLAQKVSGAKNLLALMQRESTLILSCNLLGQAHLRVLQLSRLRVVALLPSELSDEAVAKPDEQDAGEIDVTQVHPAL